jgi:hypothetical protein
LKCVLKPVVEREMDSGGLGKFSVNVATVLRVPDKLKFLEKAYLKDYQLL